MSDARETAICSFTGITDISEKDFQVLFAFKKGDILFAFRAIGHI